MKRKSGGDKGGFGKGHTAKTWNFNDRQVAKVDPNKQQFEPTEKDPIRQHQKMAGS
jgi:hypothetical protein